VYDLRDGDEVIVPATTFVATINVCIHNGLVPVFVDVEPTTFGINPAKIEEKLTNRTRMIIPVHLFGQPCDMGAIMEIANAHDLLVVEDSCETMFATNRGHSVGSMGHIGCFSLYMAHILTAGVGGVCTTDDSTLAAKMRSLVNHGLAIEQLNPDENFAPQPMVGRRFRFESVGHSFRITEFEAAVALAQLETAEKDIIRPRKRNAKHLNAGIKRINEGRSISVMHTWKLHPDNTWTPMMFPILLSPSQGGAEDKEPLMAWLNERGVETRDMLPLLNQPVYAKLLCGQGNFPISEWILKSGFYVGCHQGLPPADIQYIITMLSDYFNTIPEPYELGS
jgi:dTDP-4-amino-4,6-dideoxygalactose transaminase